MSTRLNNRRTASLKQLRRRFLNQKPAQVSRRLQLESLEGRRVMAVYTVTDSVDQVAVNGLVSLREAIFAANQNSQNADTVNGSNEGDSIVFNLGAGSETITLTSVLPTINDDVSIDGDNGAGVDITISGNNAFGILSIDIVTGNVVNGVDNVTLQRLTLRNATTTTGGGAVVSITAGGDNGFNSTLVINAVNFLNNTAGSGGAIFSAADNTNPAVLSLDVTNSTFTGNSAVNSGSNTEPVANSGGAITLGAYFQGVNNRQATGRVQSSTFTGNSATGLQNDQGGGAIYVDALSSLTISDAAGNVNIGGDIVAEANTARNGGGIMSMGTLSILDTNANNVNIGGNTAARAGGGIEVNAGTATINGVNLGTSAGFIGNTATVNGGGLHISGAGIVTFNGGNVTGNVAVQEGGGLWNSATGTLNLFDTATASLNITFNDAQGNAAIGVGGVDTQGGGGVFNDGGTLTIDGTQATGATLVNITSNRASGVATGSGGGLLSIAGTVNVNYSTFNGNEAVRAGGGIELIAGTVNLTRINLIFNDVSTAGNIAAVGPGNGGGLHTTGAAVVTISSANITNNAAGAEGGGLWNSATGTMILDDAISFINIANNVANGNVDASGNLALLQGGGGIFNDGNGLGAGGTLTILNNSPANAVTIQNNRATGLGGAGLTAGSGGGILSIGGTVTIPNVIIAGNEAVRAGGGIEVVAGTVNIVDTTIDNNDVSAGAGLIPAATPGNGGGIHTSAAAVVNIDGSTISNNVAREGGGLWNATLGTFTVTNSTISTNIAAASGGGGVFNLTNGVINLDSVTITLNQAAAGGGIAGGTGGVTLRNTIVAQNTVAGNEQNLSGGPISNTGFNLIGDPDNGTLTPASVTNIFNATNALLGPLQNNGGPTFTHRPLPGSPAIGFGDTVLNVDQRNIARPIGGNDDIGAVEVDLVGVEVSAGVVGAGDGNADEFRIINGPGANQVTVFANGVPQTFDSTTTGQLRIFGSSDDDTLTVDNSNGLIGQQIIFYGDGGTTLLIAQVPQGAGFDKLRMVGTTAADTIYNPGETNDAGAVFQTAGGLTQRIEFFGLEPVEVRGTGAGDTLTVGSIALGAGFPQALNANNAINYTVGPNSNDPFNPVFLGDLTGLVTVDGFEGLEFSNFGTLVIDAGAGTDELNFDNAVATTALTTINVDGNDPGENDSATVVGTGGTDTVAFTPINFDSATIAITGLPTISMNNVKQVIYDSGEITGFDPLTVNGTIINDTLTYDAGGAFAGSFRSANSPDFDFRGTGRLTFNGGGGFDELSLLASGGEDLVTSTATAITIDTPTNLAIVTIGTGVESLKLLALGGGDNIDLDLNVAGLQKSVDAGDGDDIVNMAGTIDATILGGAGDDFLTGSPDFDSIDGGSGNDFIFGLAGNDDLYGGEGSDLIVGGVGADRMYGQTGADTLVWNPGDGNDLFEGGEGTDILQFVGAAGVDTFTMTANGSRLRFDRQPGNIVIDAGGMEQVDVNSSISFGGILSGASVVPPVATLAAGQAALVFNSVTNTFELEIVLQGITQANLTASSINVGAVGVNGASIFDLGAGTAWNEVSGSLRRTVNLGALPPANVNDLLTGNTYVQVTTAGNLSNVRAQLTAVSGAPNLNGADTFTINDLFGTDVQVVNLGLGVLDVDAVDTVTINGRNVADNINLTNTTATRVAVTGLGYNINVDGALTAAGGATSDILIVNGNDGNDTITSPNSLLGFFTTANLRLNGGLGNDSIRANGATMTGGDGDDLLTGGANNDVMDGGAGDDTFVGGGGTDNVGGGAGSSVGDTILVAGTAGVDTVNLALTGTGLLLATLNGVTTTYGNFIGGPIATSGIEQILVQTVAGNDALTVNSVNGAVPVPITYDGGTNNDSLTLVGGTATSDTYTVGSTPDRGTSVIVIAGVTQTVGFLNIEPMVDLVAGPLTVVATNANNAINYSRGPNAGNAAAPFGGVQTGLVSVDGFETIEFSNKSTLTINALAGDDVINLNYQQAGAAPLVGPTGLGVGLPAGTFAITVNAGDPTASDKLIVNGTAGIAEIQGLTPTGVAAGNLISLTPAAVQVSPSVAYTGIEDLVLVMQGADGDGVRIAGTANNDLFEVTPGITPDGGRVNGTMGTGATSFNLPNITYSGNTFVTAAAAGLPASVGALAINIGPAATQGGTDTVVYNGTGENDIFTISNEGVTLSSAAWGGPNTPPVLFGSAAATSTTNIVINAGNGDDRINLVSATAGTETYDFNGGNPSAGSDTLFLVDPAAIAAAPNLAQSIFILPDAVDPTQQDIFGYSANPAPIDVTGIELITYTGDPGAAGVRDDILIVGPNGDEDQIRVSSHNAGVTARVTSQTLPEIHFTTLSSFFVDVGPAGSPGVVEGTFVTQNLDPGTSYNFVGRSEDILIIEGADSSPDNFVVSNGLNLGAGGGIVLVTDMSNGPGPVVAVAGGLSGAAAPGFFPGEVRLNTKAGDDVVTIDTGAGGATAGAVYAPAFAAVAFPLAPLDLVDTRIVYNGGTGGDLLRVVGTPATAVRNVVYTPGPDPTSGRIDYGTVGRAANLTGATLTGMMQVEFTGLQPVIDVIPANNLTVNASNANNVITYTQGPNTPAVAANTGLVAVDNNETIEFANKTVLTLNGLAGNDTITLANNAVAVPTGLTQIIATGSTGDDVIDASTSTLATPLRLYGGTGNDTLVGGLGGDLYFGEQGNDTLVDSPGNDAFDGGNNGAIPVGFVFPVLPVGVVVPTATSDPITATAGFDTIVVRGTGNNDVLAVTQNAATAAAGTGYSVAIFNSANVPSLTADVISSVGAADVPNAVASRPSVEEVRIEAGFGNDEIIVGHADAYVAATGTGAAPVLAAGAVPQQMVRFDVRGDAPNASDRLTVQDLGFGDLVLLRQAVDQRTGRVTVAPAVNNTTLAGFFGDVVYTGIEKVNITPINPLNGATGTNGLGQVVVFDTDPFEYNDNILNAEDIAHIELVTRSPNIDPGHNAALPVVTPAGNGDEDWYAFTADQNGTFQINTLFTAVPVAQPTIPGVRPGLPGNGALTSALYNAIGAATAPLVVGSPLLSPQGNLIGQQLQFTGIAGVTYYLRIVGLNATPNGLPAVGSVSNSLAINTYDITLAQIDNLGPQVIDPDGPLFPAQPIQIVDSPLYNLFDNKQTFNSSVGAAPAPTLVAGVLSFTSSENLVGLHVGETVTFTTGVNAGLSDTVTGINGNRIQFGSTANPTILALTAVGDAFYVGAPTPTPNVNGLTINFRDPITLGQVGVAPGAILGALDPATALNPGNYILRGDANGIIPIQNVRFAVPSTGVIGGAVLAPNAAALNTTISLNAGAGLSVANGPIVGQTLQFTTGPNTGLFGRITGYNAITGSLRFSSPFPFTIAAGDAFIISPSPIVISPVPVLATANVTAASTRVTISLGAGGVTGAGLSNVVGTYVGQSLQIISGPLAGETRTITAYNGAGVFTVAGGVVANGYSAAPAVGTVFNIVGTPATATSAVVAGPLSNATFNGGATLSAANNSYVGQAVQFTSGTLSGQARVVTGYNGATRTFSFDTPFTGAPVIGDQFTIIPNSPAATSGTVVVPGAGALTANPAGLSAVPGAYVGQILQFTSGALTGQAQLITTYNGAGAFTFANPFGAGMAAGDTFNVLPVNVAAIILDFEGALPDDRYTLTVSDEIRDFAGNQLDGNSNASQPTGSPIFPSGDGISGGDFVARFTVDSRPELGTWAAGSMWADINGNQLFDPNNTDFVNRDFAYLLGYTSDELFAGNFADVNGTFADGFDKIAAYGRVGAQWRWLIDTDNDGVPNINQVDPTGQNGFPVSGDFNVALPGDEVGIFTGNTWFLDTDGDFQTNDVGGSVRINWSPGLIGHGFTGDFDGDGLVDLGTWSEDVFSLALSTSAGGVFDGVIDSRFSFGFPGNRERPVAADMNRDGIDDIGLWTPDRATQIDGQAGEWYWLMSGIVTNDTPSPGGLPPFPATLGPTIPQRVVADPITTGRNIVAFTPTPFGNDLYMQFGDEFSLPIVGNFDPPVDQPTSTGLTNRNNPLDVNNDGLITAIDALQIINQLNQGNTPVVPLGGFTRAPFLDVDSSAQVTAIDALQIINWLNLNPVSSAGEAIAPNSAGEDTGFDEELLYLLAAEQSERDRD